MQFLQLCKHHMDSQMYYIHYWFAANLLSIADHIMVCTHCDLKFDFNEKKGSFLINKDVLAQRLFLPFQTCKYCFVLIFSRWFYKCSFQYQSVYWCNSVILHWSNLIPSVVKWFYEESSAIWWFFLDSSSILHWFLPQEEERDREDSTSVWWRRRFKTS